MNIYLPVSFWIVPLTETPNILLSATQAHAFSTLPTRVSHFSINTSTILPLMSPDPRDVFQEFEGFAFGFETEKQFNRSDVKRHHDCCYLDALPSPFSLFWNLWRPLGPVFYTRLQWSTPDGQVRSVSSQKICLAHVQISRNRLCTAWQKALLRARKYYTLYPYCQQRGLDTSELNLVNQHGAVVSGF